MSEPKPFDARTASPAEVNAEMRRLEHEHTQRLMFGPRPADPGGMFDARKATPEQIEKFMKVFAPGYTPRLYQF